MTEEALEQAASEPAAPAPEVDVTQIEIDVYGKKMKIASMLEFADKGCSSCFGRGLVTVMRPGGNKVRTMCRCAEKNIVRQHGSPADRRKYGLATPAEKQERQVEQLAASVTVKTQRLREEAAKHKQTIDGLAGQDLGALKDNSIEAAAATETRTIAEAAIVVHQTKTSENNGAIREHRHKIAALESDNATRATAIDGMREELAAADAKLQQIFDQRGRILAKNKPLLDAEIKRLEKVQRRLGLHLARYPEADGADPDPGPPTAEESSQ